MGDWHWTISGCDSRVWWYGEPGRGCWYWTSRYGQYWVTGTIHNIYGWYGYECSDLGPPVHPEGYVGEFGGGFGQWFEGGCIIYRYATGGWTVFFGDYGQGWGRLVEEPVDESQFVEQPLPEGDWPAPPETPIEPPTAPEPPEMVDS